MATTSFLYHALGVKGYRHRRTEYVGGVIRYHIGLREIGGGAVGVAEGLRGCIGPGGSSGCLRRCRSATGDKRLCCMGMCSSVFTAVAHFVNRLDSPRGSSDWFVRLRPT